MFKNELVRRVARETRLSQRVVSDVLTASHKLIGQTLREGKSVQFPGFGTFYSRIHPAGTVHHIRTKEPIPIPERRVAAFRVGEILKKSVRGSQQPKAKGLASLFKKKKSKEK